MKPARARARGAPAKGPNGAPSRTPLEPRPLKPQRKWFIVLMVVFAMWVAALLVMYFATVYPNRKSVPAGSDPLTPSLSRGERG